MNWKGKRVLVTGAGGFIGSHLTERLVREGASVVAFIRYNSRSSEGFIRLLPRQVRESLEVVAGDIEEIESVRGALKGAEVVFHLAALVGIPYSYLHPREVVDTNLIGSLNVLTVAREQGVEKVVMTSTSEVYGTARYVPIDEGHPLQPQSPYSASKIGADCLSESYYRSFGLPVAIIRPFNTYGPRQSARAVIPTIITQALVRDTIALGATSPTRDFTFVTDTVDGFVKIAESERAVGQVINIGSGREISIGELAEKIVSIVGRRVAVVEDSRRVRPTASEVERLCADNSKARVLVGWAPRVPLEQGLAETVEWIKHHIGLYRPEAYEI